MMRSICVHCEFCKLFPESPPMHDHAPHNPSWYGCLFTGFDFVTGIIHEDDAVRCEIRNIDGMCLDFSHSPLGHYP